MSTFNDIEITCEKCGNEFRGTIWTAVHAKEDPELKVLLFGGELNLVMCLECAHVSFQDHFVLYQDPAAELVAYVHPASRAGDASTLQTIMMQGFREAQEVFDSKDRLNYDPILVFGLESLVEMMRLEEERAEESQVAQVICEEHKIPIHWLRPSEARQRKSVRVLPYLGKSSPPDRQAIMGGITKLLAINSTLKIYKDLNRQIENEKDWKV